jgi:hypothetical protein
VQNVLRMLNLLALVNITKRLNLVADHRESIADIGTITLARELQSPRMR